MGLTRVDHKEKWKLDIVAVPAIGADPTTTWRYPKAKAEDGSSTIFRDVKDARLFFYEFPNSTYSFETAAPDLESLASSFLDALITADLGRQPLHIAAHSTGGLVVKAAIILARSSNRTVHLTRQSRLSLAFFGVPHSGSNCLSDPGYKMSIYKLLGLRSYPSASLQQYLDPKKSTEIDTLRQAFAILSTNFNKIWTFAETLTSALEMFEMTSSGNSFYKHDRLVVEPWSARISTDDAQVDIEDFRPLQSTHSNLSRFGEDPESAAFQSYIQELQDSVTYTTSKPGVDLNWAEKKVSITVSLFYEDLKQEQPTVAMLCDNETLSAFFLKGPDACVEAKFTAAARECKSMQQTQLDRRNPVPSLVLTPPTPPGSRRSSQIVMIAEGARSRSASPKTRSSKEKDEDAYHEITRRYEEPPVDQGDFFNPFTDENKSKAVVEIDNIPSFKPESRVTWGENQVGSYTVATPEHFDPQSPSYMFEPPKHSDQQKPTHTIEAPEHSEPQKPSSQTETASYDSYLFSKPSSRNKGNMDQRARPQKSSRLLQDVLRTKFRWIHAPANNMAWVPQIFRAVEEESEQAFLTKYLLHSKYWNSKHSVALHGFPHGRYMHPTGKLIPSETSKQKGDEHGQLLIYLPYLHWDYYGSLLKRNDVIRQRVKQPHLGLQQRLQRGPLTEEQKLIWQYLGANLPIHHRRSLDQFGYPTLANTATRDSDQILYKWWVLKNISTAEPEEDLRQTSLFERMKEDIARRKKQKVIAKADMKDTAGLTEDLAKVLMVDQLWCWILDQRTIVTCFTPKERLPSENHDDPCDLKERIREEVQGDPRTSTQCKDPYEFARLVIHQAVTGFLENPSDDDLQVLRIFEQYIGVLTERQSQSFKAFRNQHRASSLQSNKLRKPPDNSEDLNALLELRDIEDELKILRKLFNDQKAALLPISDKLALLETLGHIDKYLWQVDEMSTSCIHAQESYKSLLDMKQRQANVDEAVLARQNAEESARQGRSIMVFTLFTIVFLPLSFFTSLFGMNAREWSGESSNVTLHTIALLMGSISASVIVISLLLAFNEPIRVITVWCATAGIEKSVKGLTACLRRARRKGAADLESGSTVAPEEVVPRASDVKKIDINGRVKTNLD